MIEEIINTVDYDIWKDYYLEGYADTDNTKEFKEKIRDVVKYHLEKQ